MIGAEAVAFDFYEEEEQAAPRPNLYLIWDRERDELYELDEESPEQEAEDFLAEFERFVYGGSQKVHFNSPKHGELLQAANDGDTQAAAMIVEANYGLLVHLASKYKLRKVDLGDLVQEGFFGISRAINTFDPSRSSKFGAHAARHVKNAMNNSIISQNDIPEHDLALRRVIDKAEESLWQELQRSPTDKELYEASRELMHRDDGLSRERFDRVRQGISKVLTVLNSPVGENSEMELADFLIQNKETPEDIVINGLWNDNQNRTIHDALSTLTENQWAVVEALFFCEDEPPTYEELAAKLGMDRSRIGQLRIASLKKIKAHLESAGINESVV